MFSGVRVGSPSPELAARATAHDPAPARTSDPLLEVSASSLCCPYRCPRPNAASDPRPVTGSFCLKPSCLKRSCLKSGLIEPLLWPLARTSARRLCPSGELLPLQASGALRISSRICSRARIRSDFSTVDWRNCSCSWKDLSGARNLKANGRLRALPPR